MTEHLVDIVVIGMGPGGEDAAERLAEAGLSVADINLMSKTNPALALGLPPP